MFTLLTKFLNGINIYVKCFATKHFTIMATIKENPQFFSVLACKQLYRAIWGLGTNKNLLIEVLTNYNNTQRQIIKEKYKFMYDVDLKEHISGEKTVIGNFKRSLFALLSLPSEYDAKTLYNSLHLFKSQKSGFISALKKKSNVDTNPIIEIIMTRSNEELVSIKDFYQNKYKIDLDKDIKENYFLSEPFKNLIRYLLNNTSDEKLKLDEVKATKDAQTLIDLESNAFSFEIELIRLFSGESNSQLIETLNEYSRIKNEPLRDTISSNSELESDFKKAILALIEYRVDPFNYFANILNYYIQNGNDESLVRIVLSRSEKDLELIKEKYLKLYNRNLIDNISKKTNGNCQKLLKAIIK